MIVVTTNEIPGHRVVEVKGLVRGVVARSPTIGQGFFGAVKSVVGGHNGAYTQMCEQAREDAAMFLEKHAKDLGANAVLAFRYDASDIGGQTPSTEVIAYGTAVVIRPIE